MTPRTFRCRGCHGVVYSTYEDYVYDARTWKQVGGAIGGNHPPQLEQFGTPIQVLP